MQDSTCTSVEKRARVWSRILRTLWHRGAVEAERVAADVGSNAREIRDVCREMSELGWLELRGEDGTWVAGESATELLSRYPALRADVDAARVD